MSLSVGDALQEGWTTFRRMPWTFVFFALFAFVLSTVVDCAWTAGNAACDHPAGVNRFRFWIVGRYSRGGLQHGVRLPTAFRRR